MDDITPIQGDYYNGHDPEAAEELRKALRKEEEVNA